MPPVVTTRSKPWMRARSVRSARKSAASSGITCPRIRLTGPRSDSMAAISGPLSSVRFPAAPLSLKVIQARLVPEMVGSSRVSPSGNRQARSARQDIAGR